MAEPRPVRCWGALVVKVPEALAGELAGELGRESLGVETVASDGGGCLLRVFLDSPDDARRFESGAAAILQANGIRPDAARVRVETVVDGRWEERYQRSLRPFPLGRRFVVLPGSGAFRVSGRIPIRLVPGRAFGTGEHPTTRLCARALEDHVHHGSRWLDLGTGSAILAVVAVHCGAGWVEARDVDVDALEVAREVIRANRLSDRVRLRAGSTAPFGGEPFDGVVVNVSSEFLRTDARNLRSLVIGGGLLVVSGFPGEDTSEMANVLEASGFRKFQRASEAGWGMLVLHAAKG